MIPTVSLVDDFRIVEAEKMIHVLNAPSPAATASISIGKTIAGFWSRRIFNIELLVPLVFVYYIKNQF
ncbi:MAG: hypothetical protein MZV64_61570 [Ignavibacteriales bacterium]|nr:hypothetical protein [Ignavibacteriales bacterium]